MKTKKLTALALLFLACGPLANPPPCASAVDVTLSSVSLGRDCPEPRTTEAADRALCAPDGGGSCADICLQTSMQLAFNSHQGTPAKVEIRGVRVLDINTHQVLDTLLHRDATRWDVDQYVRWDELVPGGATLQTSYKLSTPSYGGAAKVWGTQEKYLIEVDVAIDGNVQTLSIEAVREPEVAT